MTSSERILADLSDGDWVCGAFWYANYTPTFAQRLSELGKKYPGRFRSEVCRDHEHRGTIHRYRDLWAGRPLQLALEVA